MIELLSVADMFIPLILFMIAAILWYAALKEGVEAIVPPEKNRLMEVSLIWGLAALFTILSHLAELSYVAIFFTHALYIAASLTTLMIALEIKPEKIGRIKSKKTKNR